MSTRPSAGATVYGETNAGKFTVIETLRIVLGEQAKKQSRAEFQRLLTDIGGEDELERLPLSLNTTQSEASALKDEDDQLQICQASVKPAPRFLRMRSSRAPASHEWAADVHVLEPASHYKSRVRMPLLSGNALWATLTRLSHESTWRRIAVAFVSDASHLGLERGDLLIVNASDEALPRSSEGGSDPLDSSQRVDRFLICHGHPRGNPPTLLSHDFAAEPLRVRPYEKCERACTMRLGLAMNCSMTPLSWYSSALVAMGRPSICLTHAQTSYLVLRVLPLGNEFGENADNPRLAISPATSSWSLPISSDDGELA